MGGRGRGGEGDGEGGIPGARARGGKGVLKKFAREVLCTPKKFFWGLMHFKKNFLGFDALQKIFF